LNADCTADLQVAAVPCQVRSVSRRERRELLTKNHISDLRELVTVGRHVIRSFLYSGTSPHWLFSATENAQQQN